MKHPRDLHLLILGLIISLSITHNSKAGILKAFKLGPDAFQSSGKMTKLSLELLKAKFPFTAQIIFLEALKRQEKLGLNTKSVSTYTEKIVQQTGSSLFELLSNQDLKYAPSGVGYYYQAKKKFKAMAYQEALTLSNKVPKNSSLYPFALHMQGAIYNLTNKYKQAIRSYLQCRRYSNNYIGDSSYAKVDHQYIMNKAYCTIGIGRSFFNQNSLNKADRAYQFLSKSNLIWPQILFEEGWVYHNLKQYNRTLGKMSSYKSPFLSFVYNPEIFILRALSYLKLCQYKDVLQVIKEFQHRYKDYSQIKNVIQSSKNSYHLLYERQKQINDLHPTKLSLTDSLIKYTARNGSYQELYNYQHLAELELEKLKLVIKKIKTRKSLKQFVPFVENYLVKYLEQNIMLRKQMMGRILQKYLIRYYKQIYWVNKELEVIRLEQLAQIREALYNDNNKRDRGDVKYLDRHQFQYFWDFNGEFWADELGDYVFALPNLCQKK